MTNRLNAFLVLLAVFGIVAFSYLRINHEKEEAFETEKLIVRIQTSPVKTIDSQANTSLKSGPVTTPSIPVQESSDKTFSSSVSYGVPENGTQSMSLTVTVNGTTITNISISQTKGAGKSRNYQNNFEASYKSLVLGKDIKSLNLSRVGGASITTNAFNQAIKSISNQL